MPKEETDIPSKFPLTLETQYLRLKLQAAEQKADTADAKREAADVRLHKFAIAALAMLIAMSLVFCGTVCFMTSKHTSAMQSAVNAQARMVKYGNEAK